MKFLLGLLVVAGFLRSDFAWAQAGLVQGANDPSKADLKTLNSEGRLTHISISPADKTLKYYVVGEEEGEIDFNKVKLFHSEMSGGSEVSPPNSAPEPRKKETTEKARISVRARPYIPPKKVALSRVAPHKSVSPWHSTSPKTLQRPQIQTHAQIAQNSSSYKTFFMMLLALLMALGLALRSRRQDSIEAKHIFR